MGGTEGKIWLVLQRTSPLQLLKTKVLPYPNFQRRYVQWKMKSKKQRTCKHVKFWRDSKMELNELVKEKALANMFRSKVRWYEEGEANSKYFFNLEKNRYNARTVTTLLVEGVEITNPHDILEKQRAYYEQLYTADPEISFSLTNNYDISVDPQTMAASEEQISVQEVSKALKDLSNNKTPGPDGLPPELYKAFWRQLKMPMYEAFMEWFRQRQLGSSSRRGVINVIPKSGKDVRKLENVRPITLLNADYKVLEKCIANRIESTLSSIIDIDQKGFMPNRKISTNIRRVFDIMRYAEKNELEAIILNLDFSKCFDKIEHQAIKGALQFFGFSSRIQEWTDIIYRHFTVRVQNNGHFSKPLVVNRGVRQGGCASIGYFLICAELLAICYRSDNRIKGIPIDDFLLLLGQYADDMGLLPPF